MSPEDFQARARRIAKHLRIEYRTALQLAYAIGDTPIVTEDGEFVIAVIGEESSEYRIPLAVVEGSSR